MEQKEFKDIENPIFIETVTMILNNNGNCGYIQRDRAIDKRKNSNTVSFEEKKVLK